MKKTESQISHIKSKIKVVFLGDQSTGKTSILMRFMHDKFQQGQGATVGIDFMAKNMLVNSIHLRLQLWDTAGQQRFRSLIPSYLKDATVTFIVFDITNRKSYESLRQWIQLCHQNRKEKSLMVLIGNKVDMVDQRKVKYQQAQSIANNQQIKYFEVSAKTNVNINQMFTFAAKQYVQKVFGGETGFQNTDNQKQVSKSIVIKDNILFQNQKPVINQVNKRKKNKGCC